MNKNLAKIQFALNIAGLVVSVLNMIHTKFERRSIVMFVGMLIMLVTNLITCCSEKKDEDCCCCCVSEGEDGCYCCAPECCHD